MRNDRHFAFIDGEGKTWTLQSRGTAQEARQEAARHGGKLIAGPCADERTLDRHIANWRRQQQAKEVAHVEQAKNPMIFALIPKLMKAVGAVAKGRRNAQQGYQFRGIDDLYAAVQCPMAELGIFIVPRVLRERREERTSKNGTVLIYVTLRVAHTFYAPDGSSIEAITVGEAMDTGDKASNKAMSAAMKYALIETLSLPTEGDNDTENTSPEVTPRTNGHPRPLPSSTPRATPEQIGRLNLLIQQAEVGDELIAQMLMKCHATNLGEMPGRLVQKCIERLERKVAGRELEHDDADAQVHA